MTLRQIQEDIERRAARPATMAEVAEAVLSADPVKLFLMKGHGAVDSRMTLALDDGTLLLFALPPDQRGGGNNPRPYILKTPLPINPENVLAEHMGSYWVVKSSSNKVFWLAWARFWEGANPLGDYVLTTGIMYTPSILEEMITRCTWFADPSQNFLILRRRFNPYGRLSRGTVVWIEDWAHIDYDNRKSPSFSEKITITHKGQRYSVYIPYDLSETFDRDLEAQKVLSPEGAPVVQLVGAFDSYCPK